MDASEITSRNAKARRLREAGRASEGVVIATEILTALQADPATPKAAMLGQSRLLAELLRDAGRVDETLVLVEHCLENLSKAEREQPLAAALLREGALAEFALGSVSNAIDRYENAMAIWEACFPPEHPFRERALQEYQRLKAHGANEKIVPEALQAYDRGMVHLRAERARQAIHEFEEAARINRAALGDLHPHVASCVLALAQAWIDEGDHDRGVSYLYEATEINELTSGPGSRDHVHCKIELASALRRSGQLDESRQVLEDLMPGTIQAEQALGQAVAGALYHNYALALIEQGQVDEGYRFLQLARDQVAARASVDDGLRANLAAIESSMGTLRNLDGRYKDAVLLSREALQAKERAFGKQHPSYARTLLNLATTQANAGNRLLAGQSAREAVSILEAAYPADDPRLGKELIRAGRCVDGPEGEELIERGQGMLTNVDGFVFPKDGMHRIASAVEADITAGIHAIARALQSSEGIGKDKLTEARQSLENAREMIQTQGVNRAMRGKCSILLALLEGAMAGPEAGLRASDSAWAELLAESRETYAVGTETARLMFAELLDMAMSIQLSLLSTVELNSAEFLTGLGHVLKMKNLASDLAFGEGALLRNVQDEQGRDLLRQLILVKSQLVEWTMEAHELDGEQAQQALAKLLIEKDQLESNLAMRSHVTGPHEQLDGVDLCRLQDWLADDEAILDIHQFDDMSALWNKDRLAQGRYVAFLIRKEGPPLRVDLGPAASLDDVVGSYVETLSTPPSGSHANPLLMMLVPRLRASLIQPLLPLLADVRALYVAPAGSLWRLPLEVLPTADGCYLHDQLVITYLPVVRDLLTAVPKHASSSPAVFAAPDFDLASTAAMPSDPTDSQSDDSEFGDGLLGSLSSLSELMSRHKGAIRPYHALPGSHEEGRQVAKRLNVQCLAGAEARKGRLLKLAGPRILHVASHGFFLDADASWKAIRIQRMLAGQCIDLSAILNAMREQMREMADSTRNLIDVMQERPRSGGGTGVNPMLQSGIVLAGANRWLRLEESDPDVGNGHVTAEEIAMLDLQGCELVVLSCCDSGRGHNLEQAGIYGLRRAFDLAGAANLVVSAWKISDGPASDLMASFYQYLGEGIAPGVALHKASTELRKQYPQPYYWGAFVCQGASALRGEACSHDGSTN